MELPPLIDLHEDISYYYVNGSSGQGFPIADFGSDLQGRHADIPKLKRGNVRIVFGSIFPLLSTINPRVSTRLSGAYGFSARAYSTRAVSSIMLECIKVYYSLVESYPGDLLLIREGEDVTKSMRGDKTGLFLALEGAELLEDTSDIKLAYNLGVRSIQYTWNFDNRYAASCMSKKDYGLTGEGMALLEYMNELGMIVDLAHASKKTCMEVLQNSKLPVMVTHANARSVSDYPRNLDDEVLEALKLNKGVVGFIFATGMMSREKDVEELARHVLYVYEKFGPEVLAIGTDYFGLLDTGPPRGLEDISRIGNLWDMLMGKGMSESDVNRIANGNALRVINANAAKWRTFADKA